MNPGSLFVTRHSVTVTALPHPTPDELGLYNVARFLDKGTPVLCVAETSPAEYTYSDNRKGYRYRVGAILGIGLEMGFEFRVVLTGSGVLGILCVDPKSEEP